MASKLVPFESVEQFRKMHEAGLARFVRGSLDLPADGTWRSDSCIQRGIHDRELMYYVEED